jgi:hypothetical protein
MLSIYKGLFALLLAGSITNGFTQTTALEPRHHHLAVDEIEEELQHRDQSEVEALAFTIYPNPATAQVWLHYTTGAEAEVNIAIANLLGKQVYRQKTEMRPGEHVLSLNMDELDLATGAYFVTITNGNQSITKKLIRK